MAKRVNATNNNNHGPDAELWPLITAAMREAESFITSPASAGRHTMTPAARVSALIAYARELARFIHDAERRAQARKLINKTAAALRQARGV